MKHLGRFRDFVNEYYGPDPKWEVDCMTDGSADFDLAISAKKNADAVSVDEFNDFIAAVDALCQKHFNSFSKRMISGFKMYTPLEPIDDSYVDYVANGDGTVNVGSLAWKFVFDFEDAECESEDVVNYFSPSVKLITGIARKYKWIDSSKIYVEDVETEAEGNCD